MGEGSVLVVVLVVVAALATAVAALLVGRSRARRLRRDHAALAEGLVRSQQQVDSLAAQVAGLDAEVQSARRSAEAERAYVVTTLAEATVATGTSRVAATPARVRPRVSLPRLVEARVLGRLERVETGTPVGRRAVESAVAVIAAAHGVRRALTPEHLDRAAAEAHVARRRSRRLRRQELREARRLLRAVKAQRPPHGDQEVA